MEEFLDLGRFPFHDLASERGQALLSSCKDALQAKGLFNLEGFLRPKALRRAVAEVAPLFAGAAFTHARRHNIYFVPKIDGLPPNHPALTEFETVNHTLCYDQIPASLITSIYEWPPIIDFLAHVLEKPCLYTMADPLARVNVMAYGEGEALNWHFDRSEFTITLLLQAPLDGGNFQYRHNLRSETNPNYDGVARLISGTDTNVVEMPLPPGTLTVFKGKNTAHRVTPVEGERERMVAVFSYYEQPGVLFSAEEQRGFYGRTT